MLGVLLIDCVIKESIKVFEFGKFAKLETLGSSDDRFDTRLDALGRFDTRLDALGRFDTRLDALGRLGKFFAKLSEGISFITLLAMFEKELAFIYFNFKINVLIL
jgi:hypothetical protein